MVPPTSSPQGNPLPILPALFAVLSAQFVAGLLLVCVLLILNPPQTGRRHEQLLNVVLSVSFSQVMLLAIWNALGEGKQVIRPIGSLLCVIGVWLATVFSLHWISPTIGEGQIMGLAMFVQWILIQVPLWFVRLSFGWTIGLIDDEHNMAGGVRNVQFGIKHLIAWTTFVAIVLGVGKGLLRIGSLESNDAVGFGLFVLCNSLYVWPTALGCLIDRWWQVALLSSLVLALVLTLAEPIVFQKLAGGSAKNIFLWLNSIQFIWIAGSMLIVRGYGFRLVSPRRSSS